MAIFYETRSLYIDNCFKFHNCNDKYIKFIKSAKNNHIKYVRINKSDVRMYHKVQSRIMHAEKDVGSQVSTVILLVLITIPQSK